MEASSVASSYPHSSGESVVVSVSGEETASLRECMRWADCVLSVLALKASRFLSARLYILLPLLLRVFPHK